MNKQCVWTFTLPVWRGFYRIFLSDFFVLWVSNIHVCSFFPTLCSYSLWNMSWIQNRKKVTLNDFCVNRSASTGICTCMKERMCSDYKDVQNRKLSSRKNKHGRSLISQISPSQLPRNKGLIQTAGFTFHPLSTKSHKQTRADESAHALRASTRK